MRRVSASFTFAAVTAATTHQQLRTKKYSDKVMDHFKSPRNVGTLDKNDENVASAVHGASECGDMMKLDIKVNPETLTIEDAKFKAFGCGSAIASSSFATEAIRGKTLAEALQLTNKDIAAELNLPPVKLHCSMLAEETIRGAIANYLQRKPELKTKVVRAKKPEVAAPEVAAVATAQ